MNPIRSLQKGIDMLFLFTKDRTSMTVEEIARAIKMPIPSAYRFIATLKERGLLEKDPRTGRYSLGLRLFKLEEAVRRKLNLEAVAVPLLKELAQVTGETVQLTVLNEDRGICIFVEESTSPLRIAPEKGRSLPLHAGASVQVILAFLPEAAQNRFYRRRMEKFTDRSITNPTALKKRLADIRRQGYAETSGEVYLGSVGIAAPIFNGAQRIIASVAVSGPEQRMDQKKREFTRNEVLQVAAKISEVLSYQ